MIKETLFLTVVIVLFVAYDYFSSPQSNGYKIVSGASLEEVFNEKSSNSSVLLSNIKNSNVSKVESNNNNKPSSIKSHEFKSFEHNKLDRYLNKNDPLYQSLLDNLNKNNDGKIPSMIILDNIYYAAYLNKGEVEFHYTHLDQIVRMSKSPENAFNELYEQLTADEGLGDWNNEKTQQVGNILKSINTQNIMFNTIECREQMCVIEGGPNTDKDVMAFLKKLREQGYCRVHEYLPKVGMFVFSFAPVKCH
ncbi:hypothetical protein [Pseudoalteromonas aurantia]|uniref:Uncharacterized protein n=1 Tax=Pseudoalteromonas aurantia TaxID=43654 RepID=A0ABY2VS95_9GAMM|nr:hypothetical protein [Pseudoalteromonas aurantia]TMO69716.1 hypothetical protein CWC20_20440 [Pseudoalteromonas aurantia]